MSEKEQSIQSKRKELEKERRTLADRYAGSSLKEQKKILERMKVVSKELSEISTPMLTKKQQKGLETFSEVFEDKISKNLPEDVKNKIGEYLRGAGRPRLSAEELLSSAEKRKEQKQLKEEEEAREFMKKQKSKTVKQLIEDSGFSMTSSSIEENTVETAEEKDQEITNKYNDQETKPVASSSKQDYPYNDSYDMYNIREQPLTDTGAKPAKTFEDDLVQTSYETLTAEDRNLYIGVTPQEIGQTQEEQDYFIREDQRIQTEVKEAVDDVINEIEILSGRDKDSIFNATDLHTSKMNGIEHDDMNPNITYSGVERWGNRHHIENVNASRLEQQGIIEGNPLEYAPNFGGVYASMYGTANPALSSNGNIQEAITNNLEANDTEGWYSRNNSSLGTQPISINERFSENDIRPLGDYFERGTYVNPTVSNKYYRNILASQQGVGSMINNEMMLPEYRGVASRGLSEIRKPDVSYRTPNRTIRDSGINLVRLTNKTNLELANELNY